MCQNRPKSKRRTNQREKNNISGSFNIDRRYRA